MLDDCECRKDIQTALTESGDAKKPLSKEEVLDLKPSKFKLRIEKFLPERYSLCSPKGGCRYESFMGKIATEGMYILVFRVSSGKLKFNQLAIYDSDRGGGSPVLCFCNITGWSVEVGTIMEENAENAHNDERRDRVINFLKRYYPGYKIGLLGVYLVTDNNVTDNE